MNDTNHAIRLILGLVLIHFLPWFLFIPVYFFALMLPPLFKAGKALVKVLMTPDPNWVPRPRPEEGLTRRDKMVILGLTLLFFAMMLPDALRLGF